MAASLRTTQRVVAMLTLVACTDSSREITGAAVSSSSSSAAGRS
ncbi:MAG: hypothetical protein ACRENU_16055 [Gemmatimonadaceae bacterium]